jgi:ABC-2 type transport system ATP-binding protein
VSPPSIRAVRLSKWYGRVTAVADLTVQIEPGVWGLLGPNGSGKTTFLRMVAGQLRPSLGKLEVCGAAPFQSPAVLARVGYCPEADALYDDLSALEFVSAMAELDGYAPREAKDRAVEALDGLGLKDAMERRMGGYSRGMRQRAKLAQALVKDPDVLILDEPLTGTDPKTRPKILEAIQKRAADGALVLVSTHVLQEIEQITDKLILMARGLLVARGSIMEIRGLLDEHPHRIELRTPKPRELGARLLEEVDGVVEVQLGDGVVQVLTRDPDSTYRGAVQVTVEAGIPVTSMTSPDASLEALFHYLVERAQRGAGTGADRGGGRRRAGGAS